MLPITILPASPEERNLVANLLQLYLHDFSVEVDQRSLRYLGARENIFHLNGIPGHEIVMIYDGMLKDSSLYERPVITGQEATGEDVRAIWKRLDDFSEGDSILYPTGLLELLNYPFSRSVSDTGKIATMVSEKEAEQK